MQTIYYNKQKNHTVVDVSAKKLLSDIEKEFGVGFDQKISINEELETYHIEEGKLTKRKKKGI